MNIDQMMVNAEHLRVSGRPGEAEAIYRQLIQAYPEAHFAYHGLALVALDLGSYEQAIDLINRAILINDKVPHYYSNLAEICRRSGRLEAAIASGERAIELAPKQAAGFYNLGLAYTDAARIEDAVWCYKTAVKLDARHGLAYNNLGAMYGKLGRHDESRQCYQKAVQINPKHAEAQNNLGAVYVEDNRLDDARSCFEMAIKANPRFIDAHYNLTAFKKYKKDDPHIVLWEQMALQINAASLDQRIKFYFGFGKVLEDLSEYGRAFFAYQEGCRLKRQTITYDPGVEIHLSNMMQTYFPSGYFSKPVAYGDESSAPIFIVGMPRSGSTLIEQVLDSHPDVVGAGELKVLERVIFKYSLDDIMQMSSEELRQLGKEYVKGALEVVGSDAKFFIDKMPANFFYCGLIHKILPNAKIIHSMRNPLDILLSCYSKLFEDKMDFTYDVRELGAYYKRYQQMMIWWHKEIPEGVILDINYETLVDNFEVEVRKMLDFLGLSWSDDCLAFYKNQRHVKTASMSQVRQPLYNSSVNRSAKFLPYLDEWKALLSEKSAH